MTIAISLMLSAFIALHAQPGARGYGWLAAQKKPGGKGTLTKAAADLSGKFLDGGLQSIWGYGKRSKFTVQMVFVRWFARR